MSRSGNLRARLDAELDDALATAVLVVDDHAVADRAFGRLVDLLLERTFADLRADYLAGHLDADTYRCEIRALNAASIRVGLLDSDH